MKLQLIAATSRFAFVLAFFVGVCFLGMALVTIIGLRLISDKALESVKFVQNVLDWRNVK